MTQKETYITIEKCSAIQLKCTSLQAQTRNTIFLQIIRKEKVNKLAYYYSVATNTDNVLETTQAAIKISLRIKIKNTRI